MFNVECRQRKSNVATIVECYELMSYEECRERTSRASVESELVMLTVVNEIQIYCNECRMS